nr:reverse transcriptase domain-containing protein [Tanacetum cinerariifolium]
MDQKVRTYAERQVENKRKFDNNNQAQQQPPKKQSVAIAYTTESSKSKEYVGTLPLCNRNQGHYRSDCPELMNQNHRNQTGGIEAHGMVYALGGGETDRDLDDMKVDINA